MLWEDTAAMRSKLFVPGSRPELFAKAFAGAADAISIDLEDAVLESRKAEARDAVSKWLGESASTATNKIVIVRVNAMDTAHFEADIASVVRPGVHIINLPKPENADAVRAAASAVARAERDHGITTPVRLILNIETPRALREAFTLASADPRVMGLQVGLGDLFEPLGIARRDIAAVQQVLFAVRMAAGEAGIDAFDGAFADVKDTDGYLAEARMAHSLGFAGKSCIHPSQIELAHQVFRPTDAQIEHAMKVIAATKEATATGTGAFVVDGKMIDGPFVRRAESILATARKLGLNVRASP